MQWLKTIIKLFALYDVKQEGEAIGSTNSSKQSKTDFTTGKWVELLQIF